MDEIKFVIRQFEDGEITEEEAYNKIALLASEKWYALKHDSVLTIPETEKL